MSPLVSWLIRVLLLGKIMELYRRICRVLLCPLCTKLALFSKQENCTVDTQALPSRVVMPETLPLIQPEPLACHCNASSWCRWPLPWAKSEPQPLEFVISWCRRCSYFMVKLTDVFNSEQFNWQKWIYCTNLWGTHCTVFSLLILVNTLA